MHDLSLVQGGHREWTDVLMKAARKQLRQQRHLRADQSASLVSQGLMKDRLPDAVGHSIALEPPFTVSISSLPSNSKGSVIQANPLSTCTASGKQREGRMSVSHLVSRPVFT